MTFEPKTENNLRVVQDAGKFWIEQAFIQPRQGRNDIYQDILADTIPIGDEGWNRMKPYTDFNECLAACVQMMLVDNFQLRSVDTAGLPSAVIQRAFDMLEQVVI